MTVRDNNGFPYLLTGGNEQAPMPHRQSDLLERFHKEWDALITPEYWPVTPLDRAKAIAAEVCSRRFPVTKIPKEQQE